MGLWSWFFGSSQSVEPNPGAYYTVDGGEGAFQVAKVLVVDEQGVHVRLYKDEWVKRPTQVDVASLSLGSIDDSGGFGIGHLPLSRKEFLNWKPGFLQDGAVVPDELDGYEMWKEEGGGIF